MSGTEGMLIVKVEDEANSAKDSVKGDPKSGELKFYGARVNLEQYMANPMAPELLKREFKGTESRETNWKVGISMSPGSIAANFPRSSPVSENSGPPICGFGSEYAQDSSAFLQVVAGGTEYERQGLIAPPDKGWLLEFSKEKRFMSVRRILDQLTAASPSAYELHCRSFQAPPQRYQATLSVRAAFRRTLQQSHFALPQA